MPQIVDFIVFYTRKDLTSSTAEPSKRNISEKLKTRIVGPACSVKIFDKNSPTVLLDHDFLLGIQLQQFPPVAEEFLNKNIRWLSKNDIRKMGQMPVFALPKTIGSDHQLFRLSFGQQYNLISDCMPAICHDIFLVLRFKSYDLD